MNGGRIDPALVRLMAITDSLEKGEDDLVRRVVAAVDGGATCVQVRLKGESAHAVVSVTRRLVAKLAAPVIVNDRFDIALAAGAAGAHLGADDIPVFEVRRRVPPDFLIGTSVGCEDEIANAAEADYAGIGPVYVTSSKADVGSALGAAGFSRLKAALIASGIHIPTVAIGGITARNAAEVIASGAAGIAVISALLGAADPLGAARELIRATES